eukprot:9784643-Heterocapsa_arctica.AAC.1
MPGANESHRYAHGAESLPALLEAMWPGGSCNLPDNFNPSADGTTSCVPLQPGEKYMILDDRFCVVPELVARRDTSFLDQWGKVTQVMQKASMKVSKILRHRDPRIKPFDKGGWFLVSDLIGLDKNTDARLFPNQRNPHFIYNL